MAKKRRSHARLFLIVLLAVLLLFSYITFAVRHILQARPLPTSPLNRNVPQFPTLQFFTAPKVTEDCATEAASLYLRHWGGASDDHNIGERKFAKQCLHNGPVEGFLDIVVTHVSNSNTFRAQWLQLFLHRRLQHCPLSHSSQLIHQLELLVQQLQSVIEKTHTNSSTSTVFQDRLEDARLRLARACFNAQSSRFRSWGELKYVLRSIEMQWSVHRSSLPLSRRVFLVVPDASHLPSWLRTDSPSNREHPLIIVYHSALLSPVSLPTFNSNAIESVLHRIPGLSRFFVYFNNDMLWGRRVSLFDYFRPVGLSHDEGKKTLNFVPLIYSEFPDRIDLSQTRDVSSSFLEKQQKLLATLALSDVPLLLDRIEKIRYSFAHYPRVMSVSQLKLLADDLFPTSFLSTRRHQLSRDDEDVWVPYLHDLASIIIIGQANGEGEFMNTFSLNRTQFCDDVVRHFFRSTMNDSCSQSFSMSNTTVYAFIMIRGVDDLVRINNHLRLHAPPLFLTLNDDISWEVNPEDQVGRAISEQLHAVLEKIAYVPSSWEPAAA